MITKSNILEQLPGVFICWKDKNSVFLGCNENFAILLGKSKEEIIGNKDTERKHVRDDQKVLETQKPKLRMLEFIRDGRGKRIFIITNKTLLRDNSGKISGILVVFSKIF